MGNGYIMESWGVVTVGFLVKIISEADKVGRERERGGSELGI